MIKQALDIQTLLKALLLSIVLVPISFLIQVAVVLLIFPYIHGLIYHDGFFRVTLLVLALWLIKWTIISISVIVKTVLTMIFFRVVFPKINRLAAERFELAFLQRRHYTKIPFTMFINGQIGRFDYLRTRLIYVCWPFIYTTITIMLLSLMMPSLLTINSFLAAIQLSGIFVFIEFIISLIPVEFTRVLKANAKHIESRRLINKENPDKLDVVIGIEKLLQEDYNRYVTPSNLEVSLNPNAVTYNARGKAHMGIDRQSAIADFTEAINIDNQFAEAYCNRGEALSKIDLFNLAIADLEIGRQLYQEQNKQQEIELVNNKIQAIL